MDRLLGGHGIQADTAEGRIQFQARMEERRGEGEAVGEWAAFRRGWRLGAEISRSVFPNAWAGVGTSTNWRGSGARRMKHLAEHLVREWLTSTGSSEADLPGRTKRDAQKVELARLLRRHPPMSRQWIADRLHMGSAAYVSKLTAGVPSNTLTPLQSVDYEN